MSDISERVKKIVVQQLSIEADKVTDEANFVDDLGVDSLEQADLLLKFEQEFDVEITDEAAANVRTVGDAIQHIEKLLSQ